MSNIQIINENIPKGIAMINDLKIDTRKFNNRKKALTGFTIVELLIVIVIIGILAAITIVSYIGISKKATEASLTSDLDGAKRQLELYKTEHETYPTSLDENKCPTAPENDTKYCLKNKDFIYTTTDNGLTYILRLTKSGITFEVTNSTGPTEKSETAVAAVSFLKTWGNLADDSGTSLAKTNDGGYIMSGHTKSYGAGGADAFIAKYTADGNLSWSRTWGGAGSDWGLSLIQTSDGGYAMAGKTESYGAGGADAFIAKYTADGNLSWSRTWGGTKSEYSVSLIQTSDSGYAMVGYTNSYGAGVADAFISKFTADGNLSWSRTWGGTDSDYGNKLIQTSDGGYMMSGSTSSYADGSAFIAKYTVDGNLSWSRTWGDVGKDSSFQSLIQTSDGGYAMAGYTRSYGAGDLDAFIAKYTVDGNLSWSRTWGGTVEDYGASLIRTSDGGFAMSGETGSYGVGYHDAFIAKYTVDGSLLWSRTWGSAGYENASSLIQTIDGGYAVAGVTYIHGHESAYIAKLTADGSINNCPLSMCQAPTATVSSPVATVTSPTATVSSPVATVTSPTVITTSPTVIIINAIPEPAPEMTITFSNQELYVAYPGVNHTACKEWTVPNGKQIKGFLVSQATESNFDFFTVSLDGVEKYKKSGTSTDEFVDTSAAPGTALKACTSADGSAQSGYGGEVTGVLYN
ncbi:hypothetical protein CVV43_04460 [Candidatus Saccharibacteria bacterium HGW-Saccharibacteria-1]|jgi:prepilin-type N-terminal cleavage/methylation domain-containing protein/uncharacterized delta-60 repeat protein|nr:MAG: hypothetical protein CVV43_04460 [Candidatus Saccharibacteria bacterium HGW-Saccharibacteria-1]